MIADAISIEELDLLYRIPNSVPISAKDWLNIDEMIEVSSECFSIPSRRGTDNISKNS